MNLNDFFQSKTFKGILIGIGAVIIFLFIFRVGMTVGFKKADFSYKWGENYHQNFAGPKRGFFRELGGMGDRDFIGAHGIFGKVLKIEGSEMVISGQDNAEKIITVGADTVIEKFREKIKIDGMAVDDMVVVIGEPNNEGKIEAKLIRIMPLPPPKPGEIDNNF